MVFLGRAGAGPGPQAGASVHITCTGGGAAKLVGGLGIAATGDGQPMPGTLAGGWIRRLAGQRLSSGACAPPGSVVSHHPAALAAGRAATERAKRQAPP